MGSYKFVMASSREAVHEMLVKKSADYAGRPQTYAFYTQTLGKLVGSKVSDIFISRQMVYFCSLFDHVTQEALPERTHCVTRSNKAWRDVSRHVETCRDLTSYMRTSTSHPLGLIAIVNQEPQHNGNVSRLRLLLSIWPTFYVGRAIWVNNGISCLLRLQRKTVGRDEEAG